MKRRPSRAKRPESGAQRLQKIIAAAGLTSRREAERWILEGRVAINNRVVRNLGVRADADRDWITVDGQPVRSGSPRRTYVLYKPRGVVTTSRDPHARRTAVDLVPSRTRLFSVGRLDSASEGLLLLTNDGALAHVLTHPSFEVPRTYRVSVEGHLDRRALSSLRKGVELRGGLAIPRGVDVRKREENRTLLEMTLVEGRRHQIREMMRALGHPVRRLVRVRFGPVRLGRLSPGEWRPVSSPEAQGLERLIRNAQRSGRAPAKTELSRTRSDT